MKFNLEEITKDVKNTLSEKRYIHCIGVMEQAAYLAKKYGYDIDIARVVGIAHDIAKEIPEEEKLKYVEQNNIEIDKIESVNIGLLHAKIGADICKKKYNFTEEMQNAIKYHTTGKEIRKAINNHITHLLHSPNKTCKLTVHFYTYKESEEMAHTLTNTVPTAFSQDTTIHMPSRLR